MFSGNQFHMCALSDPVVEFSSNKIEIRNQVTQNDLTLRATNSKILTEILLLSY